MTDDDQNSASRNKLLAALPSATFEVLKPHLSVGRYPQFTMIAEAGELIEYVYFPHIGMLSLLAVMRDGKSIETATVGREGVVGGMAGFGPYRSLVKINVQLPMIASRIPASQFAKLVSAHPELRELCVNSNELLLTQARITAACNALHAVELRLCRWLLQSADRAESNTIRLTQELLAEMLGVRRTSVTEVASKLQSDGIISYSRGVITILDRARLEGACCECYETLVENSATLTS